MNSHLGNWIDRKPDPCELGPMWASCHCVKTTMVPRWTKIVMDIVIRWPNMEQTCWSNVRPMSNIILSQHRRTSFDSQCWANVVLLSGDRSCNLLYTHQCYQSWYCWFQQMWSDAPRHQTVVFWTYISPLWNWRYNYIMHFLQYTRHCDVIHIIAPYKICASILNVNNAQNVNVYFWPCAFKMIFNSRTRSELILCIKQITS